MPLHILTAIALLSAAHQGIQVAASSSNLGAPSSKTAAIPKKRYLRSSASAQNLVKSKEPVQFDKVAHAQESLFAASAAGGDSSSSEISEARTSLAPEADVRRLSDDWFGGWFSETDDWFGGSFSDSCPDTAGSRTFSWSDLRDSANYAYASRPSNGWTRLELIEETIEKTYDCGWTLTFTGWYSPIGCEGDEETKTVKSVAAASFMKKNGMFVLAFRGTDDEPPSRSDPVLRGDWINSNFQLFDKTVEDSHGNSVEVHSGFYGYMNVLAPLVNRYKDWLEADCGIKLDFITGHSLGGAAATLYAEVYGEPKGLHGDGYLGVVTFGAPATHNTEWFRRRLEDYEVDDLDCDIDYSYINGVYKDCIGCIEAGQRDLQVKGMRFYNQNDWITSGITGYEHILSHYETSSCSETDCGVMGGTKCHALDTGYDWVHDLDFSSPSPRPTPRPTSRPAPRPAPRPTQRPVSFPGGAACQTLVELCMDAETQSECDRSYKFDDGDYRTCYWNGNRCKFSDGNAEVCVGGGPRPAPRPTQRPVSSQGGAACQTLVDLCMDSETRSECEQSYKFHEDAYRTCYWNGERCKFSDGNAEVCVDGGPRPAPRPTQRPTPRPTQRPSSGPVPPPTNSGAEGACANLLFSGSAFDDTHGTYVMSGTCNGQAVYDCYDCAVESFLWYDHIKTKWHVGEDRCGSADSRVVRAYDPSPTDPTEASLPWKEENDGNWVENGDIRVICRPTPRPTSKPSRRPTRAPTPRPAQSPTPRPVSEPALLTIKEENESKSSGKKTSSVMTYVIGASAVAALVLCAFAAGFYCKKGKKEKPIKKPMPIASAVPEFEETKSPQEPKRDREASVPPEAAKTSPV